MAFRQGTYHLVEIEGLYKEVEEIWVRTIDKIIEGDQETILDVTTEETIIQDKGIEIEFTVEIIIETITELVPGMTIE